MADAANAAYILKSTTPTPILASMSNGGGKVRCASQHSCVYYTEKAYPRWCEKCLVCGAVQPACYAHWAAVADRIGDYPADSV